MSRTYVSDSTTEEAELMVSPLTERNATFVYAFDHEHKGETGELPDLLGGKGAGLAQMTALGIPVPPGFTLPVHVGKTIRQSGWPDGLRTAVETAMKRLEQQVGRRFGDAEDPLLVSVRSGAPRSMPGMLDTVLNLGLNHETVRGLARVSGDETFAWDCYIRFVAIYATTVMGVPPAAFAVQATSDETPDDLQQRLVEMLAKIEASAGRPVPADPYEQLEEAIDAVFNSWDSPRAKHYRQVEGINDSLGTAVTVQAMVFGNRGPKSGTGVVFTRNPSTGDSEPYGDYVICGQGEDVVSGRFQTAPINKLHEHDPDAYRTLLDHLRTLEAHFRDMCDVEFTIEDGRVWILQTRIGKRGALAAARLAVQMTQDPWIALSPAEAVQRVPRPLRERALKESGGEDRSRVEGLRTIGSGLAASPGVASGTIVLTSDAALDCEGTSILVRPETSPEDVAGMSVCAGILTCTGGLVSHAAVVARGWGKPAVVGASHLRVTETGVFDSAGRLLAMEGDPITIDGATGEIWLGLLGHADELPGGAAAGAQHPELTTLLEWATEHDD